MKNIKKVCIVFLLLISFNVFPSMLTDTNISEAASKAETPVEIILEKGKTSESDKDKDKDTIYKPKEAKVLKVLPQTGEVITTFLYIIIGMSALLLVMGILINRAAKNYVRWEF